MIRAVLDLPRYKKLMASGPTWPVQEQASLFAVLMGGLAADADGGAGLGDEVDRYLAPRGVSVLGFRH